MKEEIQWCGCMDVRPFTEGLKDIFSRELIEGELRGEIWELVAVKNWEQFKDELSDICWGIGRIIAGFRGKAYVRVPGDGRHYRKAVSRIQEYGCKRSRRFLVNGRCPNQK